MLVAYQNAVAMLESNGDLVPGFSVSYDGSVYDIALQDDEQILLAGNLPNVNGQATSTVVRLNPDGSLDTTFDPGSGGDDFARVVGERRSGEIVVGGRWKTFDGYDQSSFIQLNGNLKAIWAVNQGGSQTINIPLIDDLTYEGDEQFQLQIASVGGGTVERGAADTVSVTITDNDPFLDQPIGNKSATVGQTFSLVVSLNFVHPEGAPLTYSATGLPTRLNISADGLISGTPISSDAASSPFSVEITVTDTAGASANGAFTLTVANPPAQPSGGGGGSIGMVFLAMLSIFAVRQRIQKL